MSSPDDPPAVALDPADPCDDEGRPLWPDSEGPRDSLPSDDENEALARQLRELQAASQNRRRGAARDTGLLNPLFFWNSKYLFGRPTGWPGTQPG